MDFATFFNQYGLILLLGGLLVFMFWSSRRRMQKQKAAQEEKAQQTVPGVKVLLQGGLYGTIVEFDPENLEQPAIIEIAPGVEIEVHSQAILRVVTEDVAPTLTEDDFITSEAHEEVDELKSIAPANEDQPEALRESTESDPDSGTKPQA
ncbi:preprotein translocase subunit YajC (plasmid) [Coraliomargarita sp. W4R53]